MKQPICVRCLHIAGKMEGVCMCVCLCVRVCVREREREALGLREGRGTIENSECL